MAENQNKLYGAVWLFAWSLTFTISMSFNKALDPNIPTVVKVFFRTFFGLLFFTPFIFFNFRTIFQTKRLKLHILRLFCTTMAISCTYYTYTHLPMSLAAAIGFSGPLITTLFAVLFLNEFMTFQRWAALFFGYAGVLIVVNPTGVVHHAVWVDLIGNCFLAGHILIAKHFADTESRSTMLAYTNVGLFVIGSVSLILYIYFFQNIHVISPSGIPWSPQWRDIILMSIMGGFGTFTQFCYISALKNADASFLAPFEYSRLVFAIPIGVVFFLEKWPSVIEWVGTSMIVASTFYVMYATRKEKNLLKSI